MSGSNTDAMGTMILTDTLAAGEAARIVGERMLAGTVAFHQEWMDLMKAYRISLKEGPNAPPPRDYVSWLARRRDQLIADAVVEVEAFRNPLVMAELRKRARAGLAARFKISDGYGSVSGDAEAPPLGAPGR